MYEYKPPRENNFARAWALGLSVCGILLFIASSMTPQFAMLPQTVGLLLFIPVIQIVGRYVVNRYLYRLREREDGVTDLEIFVYRGGTRMQLVCRVGADEITAIAPLGEDNKKPPHDLHRYAYNQDMAPRRATVLTVENEDGKCEVLFCPDDTMLNMLEAATGQQPLYDPAKAEEE